MDIFITDTGRPYFRFVVRLGAPKSELVAVRATPVEASALVAELIAAGHRVASTDMLARLEAEAAAFRKAAAEAASASFDLRRVTPPQAETLPQRTQTDTHNSLEEEEQAEHPEVSGASTPRKRGRRMKENGQ